MNNRLEDLKILYRLKNEIYPILVKLIPEELYTHYYDEKIVIQESIFNKWIENCKKDGTFIDKYNYNKHYIEKQEYQLKSLFENHIQRQDGSGNQFRIEDKNPSQNKMDESSSIINNGIDLEAISSFKRESNLKSSLESSLKNNLESSLESDEDSLNDEEYRKYLNRFIRFLYEYLIQMDSNDISHQSSQNIFIDGFVQFLSGAFEDEMNKQYRDELINDFEKNIHLEIPIQSLFQSGSQSPEAIILSFIFQIMKKFESHLPIYVLSALQSTFISYIGIFYHYRSGKLSKKHIRRFKLRLIDFSHVLSGYFIDYYTENNLKIPKKLLKMYESTKWRPFCGVVPFCVSKQYVDKFPKLLSIQHGIIQLYLPKFPVEDNSNLNEKISSIHRAITTDLDELELIMNSIMNTSRINQLHFPHKKIDLRDLTILDNEGFLRVRSTENLFGTEQELQMLLIRLILTELSSNSDSINENNLQDSVGNEDELFLTGIIESFFSFDKSINPAESIVNTFHPTFQLLLMLKHFSKTKLDVNIENSIHNLYSILYKFLNSSFGMIQSVLATRIFEFNNRKHLLLSNSEIHKIMEILNDGLLGNNHLDINPNHPKANQINNFRTNLKINNSNASLDQNSLFPSYFDIETRKRIIEENSFQFEKTLKTNSIHQDIVNHMYLTTIEESFNQITNLIEKKVENLANNRNTNKNKIDKQLKQNIKLLQGLEHSNNIETMFKYIDKKTVNKQEKSSSYLENDYLLLRQIVQNWTTQENYFDSSNYFTSPIDEDGIIISKEKNSILAQQNILPSQTRNAYSNLISIFKEVIFEQLQGNPLYQEIDLINKNLELHPNFSFLDISPLFSYLIFENINLQNQDVFQQFISKLISEIKSLNEIIIESRNKNNNQLENLKNTINNFRNLSKKWISESIKELASSIQSNNLFYIFNEKINDFPEKINLNILQNNNISSLTLRNIEFFYLSQEEKNFFFQRYLEKKSSIILSSNDLQVINNFFQDLQHLGISVQLEVLRIPIFRNCIVLLLLSHNHSNFILEQIIKTVDVLNISEDLLKLIIEYLQLEFSILTGKKSICSFRELSILCKSISNHISISPNLIKFLSKFISYIHEIFSHLTVNTIFSHFKELLHILLIYIHYIPKDNLMMNLGGEIIISTLQTISFQMITENNHKKLNYIIEIIVDAGVIYGNSVSFIFAPICNRLIEFVNEFNFEDISYRLLHMFSKIIHPTFIDKDLLWSAHSIFLEEIFLKSNYSKITHDQVFNNHKNMIEFHIDFINEKYNYSLSDKELSTIIWYQIASKASILNHNLSNILKFNHSDYQNKQNQLISFFSYILLESKEVCNAKDFLLSNWKKKYEFTFKSDKIKKIEIQHSNILKYLLNQWNTIQSSNSSLLLSFIFYSKLHNNILLHQKTSASSINTIIQAEFNNLTLQSIKEANLDNLNLSIKKAFYKSSFENLKDKYYLKSLIEFLKNPSKNTLLITIYENIMLKYSIAQIFNSLKNLFKNYQDLEIINDLEKYPINLLLFPQTQTLNLNNILMENSSITKKNIGLSFIYKETILSNNLSQSLFIYNQFKIIIDKWNDNSNLHLENLFVQYQMIDLRNSYLNVDQKFENMKQCWQILKFLNPKTAHLLSKISKDKFKINTIDIENTIFDLNVLISLNLPSYDIIQDRIQQVLDYFQAYSEHDDSSTTIDIMKEFEIFENLEKLFEEIKINCPTKEDTFKKKLEFTLRMNSIWKLEKELHRKNEIIFEKFDTSLKEKLIQEYIKLKKLFYLKTIQNDYKNEIYSILDQFNTILNVASFIKESTSKSNFEFKKLFSKKYDLHYCNSHKIKLLFRLFCQFEEIPQYSVEGSLLHLECWKTNNDCVLNEIMKKCFKKVNLNLQLFQRIWIQFHFYNEILKLNLLKYEEENKQLPKNHIKLNIEEQLKNSKKKNSLFLLYLRMYWPTLLHHLINDDIVKCQNEIQSSALSFSFKDYEHLGEFKQILIDLYNENINENNYFENKFRNIIELYQQIDKFGGNPIHIAVVGNLFSMIPQLKDKFDYLCSLFRTESLTERDALNKKKIIYYLKTLLTEKKVENQSDNSQNVQLDFFNQLKNQNFLFDQFHKENNKYYNEIKKMNYNLILKKPTRKWELLCKCLISIFPNIQILIQQETIIFPEELPLYNITVYLSTLKRNQVIHPLIFNHWINIEELFKYYCISTFSSLRHSMNTLNPIKETIIVDIIKEEYNRSSKAPILFWKEGQLCSSINSFSSLDEYIFSVLNSFKLFEISNQSNNFEKLVQLQNSSLGEFIFIILKKFEIIPKQTKIVDIDSRLLFLLLEKFSTNNLSILPDFNPEENQPIPYPDGSKPTFPILSLHYLFHHIAKQIHLLSNSFQTFHHLCSIVERSIIETKEGNTLQYSISLLALLLECDSTFIKQLNLGFEEFSIHLIVRICLLFKNPVPIEMLHNIYQISQFQVKRYSMPQLSDLFQFIQKQPSKLISKLQIQKILDTVHQCSHISLQPSLMWMLLGNSTFDDSNIYYLINKLKKKTKEKTFFFEFQLYISLIMRKPCKLNGLYDELQHKFSDEMKINVLRNIISILVQHFSTFYQDEVYLTSLCIEFEEFGLLIKYFKYITNIKNNDSDLKLIENVVDLFKSIKNHNKSILLLNTISEIEDDLIN